MDSINTERSYTEYEVTEPTSQFAIGFENFSGEDKDAIHVTLDGVNIDNLGYTQVRLNAQVIEVTPAIESGVVRLQRETAIDQAFYTFASGALFSPKSIDENLKQVRHSQQEVNDGFTFLAENTNGVVAAAEAATARATAAAELAENTDVTQLQFALEIQKLDTGITATAKYGGVARDLASKLSDLVSVKDFGAVGDGITDDTDALLLATQSNLPLLWGGSSDIYKTTRTIQVTASKAVHWLSLGATIKLEATTQQRAVLDYELASNDLHLTGSLYVDATNTAVSGFKITNYTDTDSTITLDNLNVKNCRRLDQSIAGGDGIYIAGSVIVNLSNPNVSNISMATGAGVELSQGVSGITIVRWVTNKSYKPYSVIIDNPIISEIYSDDLNYTLDQDGIRIFTDYSRDLVKPNETSAIIRGGVFKNCLGRSIKSQNEFCKVIGSHFIRTRGFSRGYGNHEIDFQVGGGVVKDITFSYEGSRPNTVVLSNTAGGLEASKSIGLVTISGVSGSVTGLLNTNRFFNLFRCYAPVLKKTPISIRDVNVLGDESEKMDYLLSIQGSGSTVKPTINLSDISVRLTQSLVRDTTLQAANYNCINITNQESTNVLLVNADQGYKADVSSFNCKGFITDRRLLSSGNSPEVTKVSAIVAKNHAYSSGMITPINTEVPAGGAVSLGSFGYASSAFIAMISVSHNANSQAVIACGGGALNLVTTASAISAGVTEPVTGDYRIYLDGLNLMLKNTTGTGRIVTGLVVG